MSPPNWSSRAAKRALCSVPTVASTPTVPLRVAAVAGLTAGSMPTIGSVHALPQHRHGGSRGRVAGHHDHVGPLVDQEMAEGARPPADEFLAAAAIRRPGGIGDIDHGGGGHSPADLLQDGDAAETRIEHPDAQIGPLKAANATFRRAARQARLQGAPERVPAPSGCL
jgi:hypothetical protein